MAVCGSEGALELDFQIGRVRHELAQDGLWQPQFEDAILPHLPSAGPVDVLEIQFREFLAHVETRTEPEDLARAGLLSPYRYGRARPG